MSLQDLKNNLATAQAAFSTAQAAAVTAQQAVYEAQVALDTAIAEGLQSGAVGSLSSVDTLLQKERDAGIGAAVAYIQANPSCAQTDAENAWTAAATTATGLPACLISPSVLLGVYSANAVAEGLIPDPSWTSLAAWIVATPAATISQIMAG